MTIKEKPADALVYDFPYDIDAVYKEIMSDDYLVKRADWVQTDEVTADITQQPNGGVKAVLDRYVRRDYPKAFKGLFPEKQHMIHTEQWEPDGAGGYKGTYLCDVQKAPVKVEAEFTLKKKGSGCEMRTLHSVTVKLPLIGGKVEKYVLGQTKTQFGDQLKYLDLRLAGTPDLLPRDVNKYPIPKP